MSRHARKHSRRHSKKWFKQDSPRTAEKVGAPEPAAPLFQALEPRLLLAATLTDTGVGNLINATYAAGAGTHLTISLSEGFYQLSSPDEVINVVGAGAANWLNTGTNTVTAAPAVTAVQVLTITMTAGADTVNIQGSLVQTVTPLTINTGAGNDIINVSSDAPTNTGNLDDIAGTVTIDAGAGSNTLNVVDATDLTGDTAVVITNNKIAGLAGAADNVDINYTATAGTFAGGINITTSDDAAAGDAVNVQSTLAGGTTSIATGAGDDAINVSSDAPTNLGNLDAIQGTLTIDGGAGANYVLVSDNSDATGDAAAVITDNKIAGMAGAADSVDVNYSATGGTFAAGIWIVTSGVADTVNVQSTLAGGPTYIITQGGADTINVSSDAPVNTGNLDAIAGLLVIDAGAGANVLNVVDATDATGDTSVVITNAKISGLAGAADDVDIWYSATGGTFAGGINITTSNDPATGDEIRVDSTRTGGPTNLNTLAGTDVILVANALDQTVDIVGQLTIDTGANTDSLTVRDNGNTGQYIGGNFARLYDAGGFGILHNFGSPADIRYSDAGGALEFLNVFGAQGGNTIDVDSTTASLQTQLDSGIGNDWNTVTINGDALSAANIFTGNTGNDHFILNIAVDIGNTGLFPVTRVDIEGGAPAGPGVNRDKVDIADASAAARALTLTYLSSTSGDVDVAGLNNATFPLGVYPAGVLQIRTTETLTYTGTGNDAAAIVGTPSNDKITVAPLSSTAALVFLNGNPYPGPMPGDPPTAFADHLPGVAGGSTGPDILLTGLSGAVLPVYGGGMVVDANNADQLYVYALSEANLVETGNTNDIFGAGWGAGVVIPGFGVGNAYDSIPVTQDAPAFTVTGIAITNNILGALLPVDMDAASFTPLVGGPSNQSFYSLIVNSGQEAGYAASGVADSITASFSIHYGILVNGNAPPDDSLNPGKGDELNLTVPGELNIWADQGLPRPLIGVSTHILVGGVSTFSAALGWSSIERYGLFSPNGGTGNDGIVNIVGDNNDSRPDTPPQNDIYRVTGGDVDSAFGGDLDGANELELVFVNPDGDPAHESLPILINNVGHLNVFGQEMDQDTGTGLPIPIPYPAAVADPNGGSGNDTLNLTPWGDNAITRWGIDVRYDGGDGQDTLNYFGMPGVSENIALTPRTQTEGQIVVPRVVIIDYNDLEDTSFTGNDGSFGDTDTLLINGTAGNDSIMTDLTTVGSASVPWIIFTKVNGATAADSFAIDKFQNFGDINFATGAGDDQLIVLKGDGTATIGINYDGGLGSDILGIQGGPGPATSDYFTVGPALGSGFDVMTFTVTAVDYTQRINFQNVEPVIDIVAGPLVVNATDADNAIDYRQGSIVANGLVSVDGNEYIEFSNKTLLVINAMAGDDVININNPATPTGLLGIVVIGGDPTASDTLIVNGTTGVDTIGFNPAGIDSGFVSVAGLPGVTFSAIEQVVINGQGGGDNLTVTIPDNAAGGGNGIIVTPGASPGSGTVTARRLGGGSPLVPLTYVNIAESGTLYFNNTGFRQDLLEVVGTAGDDTFSLNAAGTVGISRRNLAGPILTTIPISTSGVNRLVLSGLAGDDTFALTGGYAITTVNLSGGDPGASDVATLTGNGTAINVWNLGNVNGSDAYLTDGGLGTVNLTGVEVVNVHGAAGGIGIAGTDYADNMVVTPVALLTARFVNNGLAPTVVADNTAGTFSVDLWGAADGLDKLTVNGTQAIDTIGASGTTVTVAGLTVNYSNTEALALNGLAGGDTFNVTAAGIPIFVDGGDPIAVVPGDPVAGDVLNVTVAGDVTFRQGPEDDEGAVGSVGSQPVSFDHIEAASVTGAPVANIFGTSGQDALTIVGTGTNNFDVTVNDGLTVTYVGTPTIAANSMAGSDEISITPWYGAGGWKETVTVDGGKPSVTGDILVLDGSTGVDTVAYTPSTGTLDINGGSGGANTGTSFTITGVETLAYNGQGGNDTLTVNGTAGVDTTTVTPGPTVDSGTVAVNSLLALGFVDVGATGTVTVNSGALADTLVMVGTGNDDVFTMTALPAPKVQLNSQVPVLYVLTETVLLQGGDPPASDVAVLTGDGATDFTASLGAGGIRPTIVGGGLGTVSLDSIERVNLDAANRNLTVLATAGDDTAFVTPVDATHATVQVNAMSPVLQYTNVLAGKPTVDLLGGTDTLTVEADANFTFLTETTSTQARLVTTSTAIGTLALTVANNVASDTEIIKLIGGAAANTFDIGAFNGQIELTGRAGSDLVTFARSTSAGVIFDMDDVVNVQSVRPSLTVKLNDAIENLIGSPHNDKIFIDALSVTRTVDGGAPVLTANGTGSDPVPPGDQLMVDGRKEFVDAYKLGSAGYATAFGYGVISFSDIEKLAVVNTQGSAGFGGADLTPFTTAVNYPVWPPGTLRGPESVAAGDVNGDGWEDLVAINFKAKASNVAVLLNRGDGTFGAPAFFASGGSGAVAAALRDMDGDGDLDIVAINSITNNVSVLLNNGSGVFTPASGSPYPTDPNRRWGRTPRSLVIADVLPGTGYPLPDVLVGNALSGTVSILTNLGGGVLSVVNPATDILATMPRPRSVGDLNVFDADGDGVIDDILVTNYKRGVFEVFQRHGSVFGLADPVTGIQQSDKRFLNNAGRLTIISTDDLGRVMDFNGDGHPDFALAGWNGNYLGVFMGAGSADPNTLRPQVQTNLAALGVSPSCIVAGDYNSDGKPDLLWANWGYTVSVMLGNGNGTFLKPVTFKTGTVSLREPRGVALSDFNHDGGIDIAVANYGSFSITILLKNPLII